MFSFIIKQVRKCGNEKRHVKENKVEPGVISGHKIHVLEICFFIFFKKHLCALNFVWAMAVGA